MNVKRKKRNQSIIDNYYKRIKKNIKKIYIYKKNVICNLNDDYNPRASSSAKFVNVRRFDGSIHKRGGGEVWMKLHQRCCNSPNRRSSRVGWLVRCGVRVTKVDRARNAKTWLPVVMTFAWALCIAIRRLKNMLSDIWCLNSRCTVGAVTVQCKLVLVLVLLAILPDVHTENHGKSLNSLPKKNQAE